jgi:hypothetical protein
VTRQQLQDLEHTRYIEATNRHRAALSYAQHNRIELADLSKAIRDRDHVINKLKLELAKSDKRSGSQCDSESQAAASSVHTGIDAVPDVGLNKAHSVSSVSTGLTQQGKVKQIEHFCQQQLAMSLPLMMALPLKITRKSLTMPLKISSVVVV